MKEVDHKAIIRLYVIAMNIQLVTWPVLCLARWWLREEFKGLKNNASDAFDAEISWRQMLVADSSITNLSMNFRIVLGGFQGDHA